MGNISLRTARRTGELMINIFIGKGITGGLILF